MTLIWKGREQESRLWIPLREPRQVRGGTVEAAEDGLGAKMSIGRHFRVRPLKRR